MREDSFLVKYIILVVQKLKGYPDYCQEIGEMFLAHSVHLDACFRFGCWNYYKQEVWHWVWVHLYCLKIFYPKTREWSIMHVIIFFWGLLYLNLKSDFPSVPFPYLRRICSRIPFPNSLTKSVKYLLDSYDILMKYLRYLWANITTLHLILFLFQKLCK